MKVLDILFRAFFKLRRWAALASAKRAGLKIGPRTILVGDQSFGSEPFLIEIGSDCLITDGVKFITHDGSIQVPLIAAGEKIADVYSKKSIFSEIAISDNVFIGVGSVILPGSFIGKNSIVGAGSVVKGRFPSGVVIAGNPAKVICGVNDYFDRNKDRIVVLEKGRDRIVAVAESVKR